MNATAQEQRFRELYQEYQRPVLAYLFRRTDQDSAIDAAADTFLVAWRRIDDVPSGDGARPWLYEVARRVLANQRRSSSRFHSVTKKVAGLGAEPGPTPETMVIRRTEDEEILAAVAKLRPQDQELLRLVAWEELPRADIATILHTSQHAVRQRLYRITRRLARELRDPATFRAHGTTSWPSKRRAG